MTQFNFGQNWRDYSKQALTAEKVQEATASMVDLLKCNTTNKLTGFETSTLSQKSFLDIGCGSGLFSICAKMLGVGRVVGIDVNPLCLEVSQQNELSLRRGESMYSPIPSPSAHSPITWTTLSILDSEAVSKLGQFDLVYAWGSLHHTGNMVLAIQNTASLVKKNGTLVIAIYNKHWSSPIWRVIKKIYNHLPLLGKRLTVYVFYLIIALAKWIVTRKNPFNKERGMTFYYDVVDWIGGYPYEYANAHEMKTILASHGFTVTKTVPPPTPTGCVEYVCVKN